jgi:glycosyltransferase involved in cell wall biosynthesis
MNKKISIIIPAYNKEKTLFTTLNYLLHAVNSLTDNFEMIIVNDGSNDKTLREAVKLKKFNGNSNKIKIYNYHNNIGKGFALKYGFYKSSGEVIIFADADLDISSSQVAGFIKLIKKNGADIIIGSKYHPLSRISYPRTRVLYSQILKFLTGILFKLCITDTQVGLKAFKREVLEKTMPLLVVKRFAFDLELLVVASMYGFKKIVEAPVVINHNQITSTIHFSDVRNFLQDMLAIFYRQNILHFYDQGEIANKASKIITLPQSF